MKNSLLCALLIASQALVWGCGNSGLSNQEYTVMYEVKGNFWASASNEWAGFTFVDLTYENETGGTDQLRHIHISDEKPWRKVLRAKAGDSLYLSAQTEIAEASAFVRVNIYVNGVLTKTSESKGAYVVATVSGRL